MTEVFDSQLDLELRIKDLERQGIYLADWSAIGSTNEGARISKELKERREIIRDRYRRLPVNSPDIGVMVASLAAAEEEITWMLSKLSDSENAKEELDNELSKLYDKLKTQIRDSSKRRDDPIVATRGS